MNEYTLCRKREAKELRRRLVLRGLMPRKMQYPVGPIPTLGAIRQMTLGDGLRVELPAAFQVDKKKGSVVGWMRNAMLGLARCVRGKR